jgi:hypothetical protein
MSKKISLAPLCEYKDFADREPLKLFIYSRRDVDLGFVALKQSHDSPSLLK